MIPNNLSTADGYECDAVALHSFKDVEVYRLRHIYPNQEYNDMPTKEKVRYEQ